MTFAHMASSALDFELGSSDSTQLFTTQRRQDAITRGIKQFANITECYVRQSTIVSSNGVGEYDMNSTAIMGGSSDFVRLARQKPRYELLNTTASAVVSTNIIQTISGKNFERRDPEWLNEYEPGWQASSGGTPRYYYERIDGGRRYFGLYPPPSFDSTRQGRVVLPYVADPPESTASTYIPYSFASTSAGPSTGIRTDLVPYHQAAVHFAASELERLRVNTEAVQMQMQLFGSYVERYFREMRPKGGQTVKTSRSYFTEARKGRKEQRGPRSDQLSKWF